MAEIDEKRINEIFAGPRILTGRAETLGPAYQLLFDSLVLPDKAKGKNLSEKDILVVENAGTRVGNWLSSSENQNEATETVRGIINFFAEHENDILSESHDLLHIAELSTSYLDDKKRGVETSRETLLAGVAIHLLHDTGRRIEKKLTFGQLDLSGGPHHDILSFVAAKRLLDEISGSLAFPENIKEDLAVLIFTGLRRFGSTGDPEVLAATYEPDRRQLLGSPTVARDMLYMLTHSGMKDRTLSPRAMEEWPEGYVHYDSGGFFGQQRAMATGVFRDESIRIGRRLDAVYDSLATEAVTVILLGCGDDEQLKKKAFDTNFDVDLPEKSIKTESGPWWPKKPVPREILTKAQNEAAEMERAIPDKVNVSKESTRKLSEIFLQVYSTILDPSHLKLVQEDLSNLSEDERRRWVRIMYYAHLKNSGRYGSRIKAWEKQEEGGTFMAAILKPFIGILRQKRVQAEKLSEQFSEFLAR
ncbi:MAG: hypothetical protein UX13_C0001G0002 [Candidatus Woesebacteria bacterium GW2011_GWB1_45_5]|uniref:Uncharacterized protein n=1 Tax=Candidatus Woesebacteria bacterium GW2011_GWB1_45_5 TaxID=1618581 RepID=A0A0G1MRD6_9BACT|nr:MAG: hypothetical protein UX13_C0001G0002 [Candidatus Woesebacteria bacterium GW2011_GWB1_45_5]